MGSRLSAPLAHPPIHTTRNSHQVAREPQRERKKMKLLLPSILLLLGALAALAAPPAEAEGGSSHNPPPSALEKELLAEYLAREYGQMGSPDDYQEPEETRMKRWWGGNKYKDNKSYGFWITALNKAGNVKRGKRSAFLPAMGAIVDDHNPLTGPSDYSDVAELVPDHKASLPVHQ